MLTAHCPLLTAHCPHLSDEDAKAEISCNIFLASVNEIPYLQRSGIS
jgi:hypothetical protein